MLKHSIDHIFIREDQIFSYGWGFFIGRKIINVDFHFDNLSGQHTEVSVDYGRQRDDVKKFFLETPEAENAGYLLLAGVGSNGIKNAFIRWHLDNDEHLDTPIDLKISESPNSSVTNVKTFYMLFQRSLSLFRKAGIKALIAKVRKYLLGRPQSVSESEWKRLKSSLIGKRVRVVVDHDMGGGANIFRGDYVSSAVESGIVVILLSFHVASLQHFIQVFDKKDSLKYSIPSAESLLNILPRARVDIEEILYNCAVTFRDPHCIVQILLNIKKSYGARLLVAIHDYFLICPSHFLLDYTNKFCGVPDKRACSQCIANHKDGFVSLTGCRDVEQWRTEWLKLLKGANEIRLFSQSSVELLSKAYPLLSKSNWNMEPHRIRSDIPLVELSPGHNLHIGVVGAIGKHKGSLVISDLVSEITKQRSNVKITVIGTLEAKVSSEIVTVTGPYESSEMASLIRESGANVFLFPSICPETFSYVSHELVKMGLPYACFNLGAPSDLARSYKNGLVLSSFEPQKILEELSIFRKKFFNLTTEHKL